MHLSPTSKLGYLSFNAFDYIMFPIKFSSESLQIFYTNSLYRTFYRLGDFKLITFIIVCMFREVFSL